MSQEKEKENATISLLFKSLFHKRGKKKSNIHYRKQFLFKEEGCGLTGRAPQLQGASLFSCPPEAVPRARIPPGSRAPQGPLSSPGTPFSTSFRPLARPGGLGLAPTLTTSEWAGEGGQPRPARPLTLTSALVGQSKTPGLPPAWGKKTSHGTQPGVPRPHSGAKT